MDFYIVDAKTGKCRGPVVMDPWDDISVEEVYPDNHCGECPVWLADAEGGAECEACICNEAAEDAHNNIIRGLIEANEDIAEARKLLVRANRMLFEFAYDDNGFLSKAAERLSEDIVKFLEKGE